MHRLRRLRARMPGGGDLLRAGPAGRVEAVHPDQRGLLQEVAISDRQSATRGQRMCSPLALRGITKQAGYCWHDLYRRFGGRGAGVGGGLPPTTTPTFTL